VCGRAGAEVEKAMRPILLVLILAAVIPAAGGCKEPAESHMWLFSGAAASRGDALMVDISATVPNQRYIAESHKIQIFTSESGLQHAWESAVAFCGTLQCEVVSSSVTARTPESAPSGDLSVRVAPRDLDKLLGYVTKLGIVARHMTNREDETTEVVDTDAKIKNLTSFRDSLRATLAKPSATAKDLVAIQQQLTDTQSELDSETAQRKILANETEKVAVEISFMLESYAGNARGFDRILNALSESGDLLADSTASLITTVVALLPWLVVIVPGVWLLVKAWKALRRRRARKTPPATTAVAP